MSRLTIEDAGVLLATLEDVERVARRRTASRPAPFAPSPPLAELQCIIIEASRISDLETHLWTVGALALRDVRTRVHLKTWDIGRRTFPHAFDRLIELDPRAQVGDPYPMLMASDIDWSEDLPHLPAEIWLTHREIRLMTGSIEARARAAMAARYPVAAIRWSLRSAASMGPRED